MHNLKGLLLSGYNMLVLYVKLQHSYFLGFERPCKRWRLAKVASSMFCTFGLSERGKTALAHVAHKIAVMSVVG